MALGDVGEAAERDPAHRPLGDIGEPPEHDASHAALGHVREPPYGYAVHAPRDIGQAAQRYAVEGPLADDGAPAHGDARYERVRFDRDQPSREEVELVGRGAVYAELQTLHHGVGVLSRLPEGQVETYDLLDALVADIEPEAVHPLRVAETDAEIIDREIEARRSRFLLFHGGGRQTGRRHGCAYERQKRQEQH